MEDKNVEVLEEESISEKEAEIIKSYDIEETEENNTIEEPIIIEETNTTEEQNNIEETNELEEDIFEEEDNNKKKKNKKKKNKKKKNIGKIIVNTLFTFVIIVMILVLTDVICFTKFDMGPFFVIPLTKHNDGGTIEYYGLGYKVIDYNQTQGRRDREIGYWSLKYNVEPITFQDIDLAIELTGNETLTYQKYDKKFVRIISTLQSVNKNNNTIKIGYKDEDGKYSLDIICDMVKEQKINKLEKDKEITVIGTFDSLVVKTKKNNNQIYMSNCFAEQ